MAKNYFFVLVLLIIIVVMVSCAPEKKLTDAELKSELELMSNKQLQDIVAKGSPRPGSLAGQAGFVPINTRVGNVVIPNSQLVTAAREVLVNRINLPKREGESCVYTKQCVSGLFCITGLARNGQLDVAGGRKCLPVRHEGDRCEFEGCDAGLICTYRSNASGRIDLQDGRRCLSPKSENQPCAGFNGECQTGLICKYRYDNRGQPIVAEGRKCLLPAPRTPPPAHAGESCEGGRRCESGLICDFDITAEDNPNPDFERGLKCLDPFDLEERRARAFRRSSDYTGAPCYDSSSCGAPDSRFTCIRNVCSRY